jgi:hypothetical protein
MGPTLLEVQVRWRRPFLNAICDSLGWTEPPWEDPSDIVGDITSMGNGRYSLFLSLAWAVQDLDADPALHVHELIETVETIHRSASENQFEELMGNCKVYPHLLDRNIYWSYYLPFDIPKPIHTLTQPADDDPTPFSFGSSIHLLAEIETLVPLMKSIIAIRGEETHVPTYSNYTWGSVNSVCETLLEAAQESINLNLPLLFSW